MKGTEELAGRLAVVATAWSLVVAACPPTFTPRPVSYSTQRSLVDADAPLFDSVDENLNPVSMADMIDGKPLVLACTSCT